MRSGKSNGHGRSKSTLPEMCIAKPAIEELFGSVTARLDAHERYLRRILLALDVDPDKEGL